MTDSTARRAKQKPGKPREDFPLFVNQSGGGRWCKKYQGKFHYFGHPPRQSSFNASSRVTSWG